MDNKDTSTITILNDPSFFGWVFNTSASSSTTTTTSNDHQQQDQ
jgi:hypothetical protein